MPIIYKDKFRFDEVVLPYSIYLEKRQSVRMSIARTQGILRLPFWFSKRRIEREHVNFEDWIRKQLLKSDAIRSRFAPKRLSNGTIIQVMGVHYEQILYPEPNRKNHHLALDPENKQLIIKYPNDEIFEVLPKLKSRVFAKYYKEDIKTEVAEINRRYFGFEYKDIRLKYNKSNWGSCSTKQNINLSTRVLLLPNSIREYIIVHELAHLKEMNHSSAFWNLVESALPGYKEAERWLKKEGRNVEF